MLDFKERIIEYTRLSPIGKTPMLPHWASGFESPQQHLKNKLSMYD